jgi:hypothetical protein
MASAKGQGRRVTPAEEISANAAPFGMPSVGPDRCDAETVLLLADPHRAHVFAASNPPLPH